MQQDLPSSGPVLCINTTVVGPVSIFEEGGAVAAVRFARFPSRDEATSLLREAEKQLGAYFAGRLQVFDLPLGPAPTSFQVRVRAAMLAIPAGATRSYGELAGDIDSKPRAIGQACGRNPIPIIVPCHRVLAAGGAIGGYSGGGGLTTKRRLLELEGAHLKLVLSEEISAA